MSDEKIEVQIADRIAPSIEVKLEGIAASARTGYEAIERLKTAMKVIDSSAINALSLAHSRAQKAMNDSAIASQRLRTEEQKTSAAALQAATSQQRLQTAATQTAAAQQALAAASAKATAAEFQAATAAANTANAQTRAASAALRLEQAQARAARSSGDLEREAEALKRELNPLYDAQERYNAAVERSNMLFKAGVLDTQTYFQSLARAKERLETATTATQQFNQAQVQMGKNAQLNRAHLTNLGFQLNDIGVSLAGGQNPLVVLVQQGSQIAGIASQAGVGLGTLAKEAGLMLLKLAPIAAVIGAIVAAINLLASEASKGAGLDEYAKKLGATDKQIRDLNLNTVTFGDTMKGLFRTISEVTGAGDMFDVLWENTKRVFTNILKFIGTIVSSIVALFQASFRTIVDLWDSYPDRFMNAIAEAVNGGLRLWEMFINAAITGINKVIEALNTVTGTDFKPFESISFDKIDTSQFAGAGKSLSQTFVDSYVDNLKANQNGIDNFMKKWQANSVAAAKERIAKALEGDKDIENRAAALAKVNAQLDNELQRMFLLRPEREAQAKFDQIEEQLLGKKIKLTDAEAAAIRRKIDAIQQSKDVQAQFDRIYEDAMKPLRDYTTTLQAAQKLLALGPKYQEAAARATVQAREAYLNSIDPLRQVNKEISQQNDLLAMMPREREVAQQMQQVENQLLAAGIILNQQQTQALKERFEAQQALNLASQAEAQVWESTRGARETYIAQLDAIAKLKAGGTISGGEAAQQVMSSNSDLDFTNTQTEVDARVAQFDDMYRRIEELRQKDLISEQDAAALRMRVWVQTQTAQMQSASNFFGQLSQLQKSENSKIAAIGKAAAIAKAIMDTYTAATGAYASLASIPYVGPALGAAAAAAAIAAGLANVQAIRSQPTGFMTGGYTGDIPKAAIAGNVHGQEYVMDANSTARIGRDNLDRLRAGANGVQGMNGGGSNNVIVPPAQVNQKFVNVIDPSIVGSYMNTEEGEELVLNIIERNPSRVSSSVNGA